jgi:G3E family GTPase
MEVTMKLVILAGFLGSGKTTLLLELLRSLAPAGPGGLVVLENEVGEVGIDGPLLQAQGLEVRELFSGCVCCTLAGDLVTTLAALKGSLDPACVFLEASGVARLESLLATLDRYDHAVNARLVLTLLDLERLELLREALTPLIDSQIGAADLVVLNKVDSGGDTDMMEAGALVAAVNPGAELFPVSALEGTGLEALAGRIASWM